MLTRVSGTGDGSAPVVNITFPYIDKSHIQATVNGFPAPLTWTGASQVQFVGGVPVGAAWRVFRQTPTEPALVTFTDPALLLASDLNEADMAHRYRDEELFDSATDTTWASLRTPEPMAELPVAETRKGTVLGFSVANGLRELLSYSALATKLAPYLQTLISTVLKGDPGSPGEGYPTRAAMAAAASPLLLNDVYLAEPGLEGKFVVDNLSTWAAAANADTTQGVFVQSTVDPTKVYRRVYDGRLNVRWFGAVGDNVTDDSTAFLTALSVAKALSLSGAGYSNGSPRLYIPTGHYYLGTATLDIVTTMIIEGDAVGQAGGGSTVLRFDGGTTGIRVQRNDTSGGSGGAVGTDYPGGQGSIIRNLYLLGGYAGVESEAHGIQLRARAAIRDVFIDNFPGDGFHIAAESGSGSINGNANGWSASHLFIRGNRHGIYLLGGDTNAGYAGSVDLEFNRGWGVSDNSFLGNTYVALEAAGNGAGPYQTTNLNARSLFLGCYSEGDQSPSSFAQDTTVLGGLHSAGYNAEARVITADNNGLNIENGRAVGNFSADTFQVTSAYANGQGSYRLGDTPGGFGFQAGNLAAYPLYFDLNQVVNAPSGVATPVVTLSQGPQIFSGFDSPEGSKAAPAGSLFLQTGASGSLFLKASGSDTTGWVQLT